MNVYLMLLLFAFRDLWKVWGDLNFQIFTELPVAPQTAGVVGIFNCCRFYDLISFYSLFLVLNDAILIFLLCLHFHYFFQIHHCMHSMCLTSLTDSFYDRTASFSYIFIKEFFTILLNHVCVLPKSYEKICWEL